MLLLAFAVVAMHQLGAGHQPSTSAVHASQVMAAPGQGGEPGKASVTGQQPAPKVSERGCSAGCPDGGHEAPMAGHAGLMLCLAVLPLLLAFVGRRRALLTCWHRVLARVGTTAALLSRPVAASQGPPLPSFIRFCVSRT